MKQASLVLTVLVALVLTLAACQAAPTATPTKIPTPTTVPQLAAPSPTPAPATPTKAAAPVAPAAPAATAVLATPTPKAVAPKGKIVMAITAEPATVDALLGTFGALEYNIYPSVLEYLVKRDTKTLELKGHLAEKWEQVKPDTWRYTLRKGVKFQNGEPFNADAVVYSYNIIANKDMAAALQRFWPGGGKATKVDEYTVDVTSSEADPIQPLRVPFLAIDPPKWAKENPEERPIKLIGTGPYKFVEWVKGQYMKITANDDYWGPAPKIKDATILWRGEAAVRAAMLRTGEADWAYAITPEDAAKVPKHVAVTSVDTLTIRIDTQNPVLKDKRVRLALNLGFDKDAIVNKLFAGFAEPAKGQPVGEYVFGFNPNIKPRPYDPDQAKKLVAEAKAAGIPTDTTELDLVWSKGRLPHIDEMGEAIADSWNKVGLKIKMVYAEHNKWREAQRSVLPGQPRVSLLVDPHSNEIGDSGQSIDGIARCGGQRSTYCNNDLDPKMKQAAESVGDQRVKLYQELWQALYDDAAHVPLFRLKPVYGLNKRLDFTPRMDGLVYVQEMSLAD